MSPKYQITCGGDILYPLSVPIQNRELVKAEVAVQRFEKESGAELERVRVRIVCMVVMRTVGLGLGGCSEAVVLENSWIDAPIGFCGGFCVLCWPAKRAASPPPMPARITAMATTTNVQKAFLGMPQVVLDGFS